MISCIDSVEHRNNFKKGYSENEVIADYDNNRYMEFYKEISKQWILKLIHLNNKDIAKIKKKKDYILNLQDYFKSQFIINSNSEINLKLETDIKIYAYFLYFSGIILN